MATCKKCGKPIEDGKAILIDGFEYCSECSGKEKADESYLDSLLSSVSKNEESPLTKKMKRPQTTAAPIKSRTVTTKINTDKYNILSDSEDDDFLDNLFDSSDIPDFPADINLDKVFTGQLSEEVTGDEHDEEDIAENVENGDILYDTSVEPEGPKETITEEAGETDESEEDALAGAVSAVAASALADAIDDSDNSYEITGELPDSEGEPQSEEDSFLADLLDSVGDAEDAPEPADDPIAALDEAFAIAEGKEPENIDFFGTKASPEEIEAAERAAAENGAELFKAETADETAAAEALEDEAKVEEKQEYTPPTPPEFDADGNPILIPAEIPEEEPVRKSKVKVVESEEGEGGDEDILEFWNKINADGDGSIAVVEDAPEEAAAPPEFESDPEQDELAALLSGLPGVEDETEAEVAAPEETVTPKKKKGFFARIFGNVVEELTEEELEEKKQAALDDLDRKEEAQVKAKEEKEEAKKAKAEAAAEAKKAKAEAAAAAKQKKAEEKKEKADKKEALRKALVEEIEENEGKINKVGASLIFLVFGAVFAFIAVGTSIYTYRVAIEQAEKDFDDDKYEEAYKDIYGIDVKEEDQLLYDRIMVVNYVNTQLLAYLRYTGLEMENEALDSLLKGLRRYEKYIYYATELEVDEDMEFLKGEILEAMSSKYGLSESEAYAIINSETQEVYSQAVRDIVANLTE